MRWSRCDQSRCVSVTTLGSKLTIIRLHMEQLEQTDQRYSACSRLKYGEHLLQFNPQLDPNAGPQEAVLNGDQVQRYDEHMVRPGGAGLQWGDYLRTWTWSEGPGAWRCRWLTAGFTPGVSMRGLLLLQEAPPRQTHTNAEGRGDKQNIREKRKRCQDFCLNEMINLLLKVVIMDRPLIAALDHTPLWCSGIDHL